MIILEAYFLPWCVGLATLPPSLTRLSRQNVGASMSHKPMGLHDLLQGQLYLYLTFFCRVGKEANEVDITEMCFDGVNLVEFAQN
jgi:hypothetical protein